jgi:hypothetical protein
MSIENRGIGGLDPHEEEGYPVPEQDVNCVAGFASFNYFQVRRSFPEHLQQICE